MSADEKPREWFVEINEVFDEREQCQSGMAYSQTWLDEMEMTGHGMVRVIEYSAFEKAQAELVALKKQIAYISSAHDLERDDLIRQRFAMNASYENIKKQLEANNEEYALLVAENRDLRSALGHERARPKHATAHKWKTERDEARAEVEQLQCGISILTDQIEDHEHGYKAIIERLVGALRIIDKEDDPKDPRRYLDAGGMLSIVREALAEYKKWKAGK